MIQKWGKERIFAAQNQSSQNSCCTKLVLRGVKLLTIIIAAASVCGIGQSQIFFQPPANDNFSNAIPLTGYSLSVTSLNMWASSEPGEPAHGGHPATHSTWWRWVAPESGLARITSILNFGTGVVISRPSPVCVGVYTGKELSSLVSVSFLPGSSLNSDGTVTPSFNPTTYIFQVTAGQTYYIAADTISPATCSLILAFSDMELTQPTILTNLMPGQPVILEFAPVDTNSVIASLQAYAGTNQLPLLTNNSFQFVYNAESAGTVHIWALGTNSTGQTLFPFTNYLTFKPPNDNFSDATTISDESSDSFLTDIELATSEPGESNLVSGVTLAHTVWWKWTPLTSVPTEFKLTSPRSQLVIFRGTTLTNLELVGILGSTLISWYGNMAFTFTPELGDTYYILGASSQSFTILGGGTQTQTLSWSFVPHTLELTPAGSQQGVTDNPIELEASSLESNSPSSNVEFVIAQRPPGFSPIGLPPIEIGRVVSSAAPPYRATWTPTNAGVYYVWARCTNNFGALRESDKTNFRIRFSNDDFAGATVIPSRATNASYSFTTIGATFELGEPRHDKNDPAAATRWWKWTPSYSGIVRLEAIRELKAVPLEFYVGNSLTNLQLIASNFRRTYRLGISGALTIPVHAHRTYLIRVDDLYPDSHELGIPPSNITLSLQSTTNGPRGEILLSFLKNSRSGPVPFSWILMPDGSPVSGTNFLAQLYAGTNVMSLHAVGPAQPFWIPIYYYPSIYTGGVPWPVPVILPDIKAYSPVVAQIRVWDSNAGASYEAAQAAGGLTGKSNAIRLIAGSEDAGPARLNGISTFKLHSPD